MALLHKPTARIETVDGHSIVFDYFQYGHSFKRRKRALLSYLTGPVVAELNGETLNRFSNHGLGVSWARVLNEMGYIVDIIDWDNGDFVPRKDYDLIVFHGGKNFDHIMQYTHNKPKIIHWLTGSYWKFNNDEEDKRLSDFKKRHGATINRDRFIFDSEEAVNQAADAIIVLGDPSMRSTYPASYKKVLTINNASYPDNHFDVVHKDYETTKHNFLFFAGSGSIHKGLDLLIDSFKDLPDQHLYIVANTDPSVMKVFSRELKLPNIHLFGEVNMRTEPFYEAMDTCAWAILPSCSEGQAGSVIEAMNQGLIPIVSRETRLDTTGFGITLATNTIAEIKRTVTACAAKPVIEIERNARRVRAQTIAHHSPSSFRHDLTRLMKQALR